MIYGLYLIDTSNSNGLLSVEKLEFLPCVMSVANNESL